MQYVRADKERGVVMEQKEALTQLNIMATNMVGAMEEMSHVDEKKADVIEKQYEALDMAITALKKRPAYLRLIEKYQTRDKNQSEELHRLLKYRNAMKAEIYTDTIETLDCYGYPLSYEQNFALCPRCGSTVGVLEGEGGYHSKYCECCGQHTEWYEVEHEQMD